MKLKNYIVEEEEGLSYYIPKIQAECKPFLKDIKNAAGTIFRIDRKKSFMNTPIWKKSVRKDREPLDTPIELHDLLDEWFLRKFGWKARSEALFCWPLKFKDSSVQGKWMVFPVGSYKYVWSDEVSDLWGDLGDFPYSSIDDMHAHFIHKFAKTYRNDKIKMSVLFENEIMVKCDYAYMVRPELMEQVNEMLGLNWQGAKFRGRKI